MQSRIALVYVLFDRAIEGRAMISQDELADVFRLALDHYQPFVDLVKLNRGCVGLLYEHGYFIGNSVELYLDSEVSLG